MTPVIRPYEQSDVRWAERLIGTDFGDRVQARLGSMIDALASPGFVAEVDGRRVGIVTFSGVAADVEIVYLEAVARGVGVGTALVEAVAEATCAERLWLVTTNDNLDALRLYQRRGSRISEVRVGAVMTLVEHSSRPLRAWAATGYRHTTRLSSSDIVAPDGSRLRGRDGVRSPLSRRLPAPTEERGRSVRGVRRPGPSFGVQLRGRPD